MSKTQIFTNQSTNGSSVAFLPIGTDPTHTNDLPVLLINANNLTGTTITMEAQDPNGNWIPTDPVNDIWTGNDYSRITSLYENSSYIPLRLTISGAVVGTSVNAWLWECEVLS